MTISEFWDIIEKIKDSKESEEDIKPLLEKLTPEEIISFQEHFDTLFAKAYTWKLWGAAYLIEGGCSDDGFMDFRYGLISKGRDIYEKAIEDPDSLVLIASNEEYISNESFGYVADEVYETLTKKELPSRDIDGPSEPLGEEWDFDDVTENQKRLPKLSSKFDE